MSPRAWRAAVAIAIAASAARVPAHDAVPSAQEGVAAAQALLWGGRLAEAERSFTRLLALEDGEVDALLGLAQARRWAGRPLAAREAALRAVALAPDRPDLREELAWSYADFGRGAAARAALGPNASASPALRARLDELGSVAVKVTTVAYEDSNDVVRIASRLAAAIPLRDAALTLVAGGTRVAVAPDAVERGVVGAALSVPLGRIELSGGWAAHRGIDERLLQEGHLALRVALSDRARVGLSARRRPLMEIDSLAIDEVAYHGAGPGGALDPARVARRGVDELRLSLQAAPLRAIYLYVDARAFTVSDANRGWSTAAGTGVSVGSALGLKVPVDLVLRWDTYLTGFAEPRPGYFSPSSLDGHSPGAEVRVRAGRALELFAEGGFTTSLLSDPGPGGWFSGGGAVLRAGRLTLSARAQVRNDPWYESRRAFVSVGGPL